MRGNIQIVRCVRRVHGAGRYGRSGARRTDTTPALQQATVAIRARLPLAVLEDVIQPFPTFSEAFLYALQELGAKRLAAV